MVDFGFVQLILVKISQKTNVIVGSHKGSNSLVADFRYNLTLYLSTSFNEISVKSSKIYQQFLKIYKNKDYSMLKYN